MMKTVTNEKRIELYVHCSHCVLQKKRDKLAVGWTAAGIQVWCETCESNVLNIDFEGARHPANTTRIGNDTTPKKN